MVHSNSHIALVLGAIAVLGLSGLDGAQAQQEEEYVSKARTETLYQEPLPGMEGKEMIVKEFFLPPGYVGGTHKHPGPVFVYVLEGELNVETDQGTQTFSPGELYREPANTVMRARNISTSDDTEILVFQVGDIGTPMMIRVE